MHGHGAQRSKMSQVHPIILLSYRDTASMIKFHTTLDAVCRERRQSVHGDNYRKYVTTAPALHQRCVMSSEFGAQIATRLGVLD